VIDQRIDAVAKREEMLDVAKRIRDENKRKVMERMENKNMVKISKMRKLVEILDRETDQETKRTLVTLTVKAEDREMYDVDIVEEIPKSYAEDISMVEFSVEPEILEDDPIIKWNFDSIDQGEEVEVSYWVDGEKSGNSTTIAAEEPFEEVKLRNLLRFLVISCIIFIVIAFYIVRKKKDKK